MRSKDLPSSPFLAEAQDVHPCLADIMRPSCRSHFLQSVTVKGSAFSGLVTLCSRGLEVLSQHLALRAVVPDRSGKGKLPWKHTRSPVLHSLFGPDIPLCVSCFSHSLVALLQSSGTLHFGPPKLRNATD